jgi:hypothetical protein
VLLAVHINESPYLPRLLKSAAMRSWLVASACALATCLLAPKPTNALLGNVNDQDDTVFTLVLLQMIQQRQDPNAMQSLYPLLLSNLMGDSSSKDMTKFYYLLLGAGNDSNMQQWLPLILNNKNKGTDDKLLMLIFMQQNQVVGGTDMNNMFPLLLLNANDDKYCKSGADKCMCKTDNSEMLLYIMLLNGNSVGPGSVYNNFMFMMFDDNKCDGKKADGSSCTCTTSDKIEGGIDAVTYMMLMQMNPVAKKQLPPSPPQRSIDVRDLLKQQMFTNLGPEYAWMANVNDAEASDLVKFQLYQQMGIPPNVMSLLSNRGQAKTSDEKFALIQWMSQGNQDLNIETMSMMLGIEDSKQFYIHSMIEQGNVDPMTASMLLASSGSVAPEKMKEMLILAATGQIDPETFATIARPYVPQLPAGIYPGQDLYFIHLEMLDLNTCAMIEPQKRRACGSNFGSYITAEQCEVHPYCCYNPYFGKVKDVPWCYYNIFFVFHDQYKLRVREADKFKGPQDCPPLFRYGLNLDPFMYYKAVADLKFTEKAFGSGSSQKSALASANTKLGKLIHYRRDVGFAGIEEFHCRAILGACWDANAAQYSATYNIPQCYEEQKIELSDVSLQLYDPKLFKPVVPKQFQAAEGECDTNYFHISTLYYKRRACTYSIDMIKYGHEFNPLNEPSRQDCLFRLGCCYEDNDEVMQQYPFMPRCYHRVKNEVIDARLHDYKLTYNTFDWHKQTAVADYNNVRVCGSSNIDTFLGTTFQTSTGVTKTAILTYYTNANGAIAGEEHLAALEKHASVVSNKLMSKVNAKDNICLYMRSDYFSTITSAADFWKAFDVFDKQYIIETQVPQANIPESLRGLMADLF